MIFQDLLFSGMAGWATVTTRFYSWNLGQFWASQARANFLDGLMFQRYLYLSFCGVPFSFSCLVVIHKYVFATWPAEQLLRQSFLRICGPILCISGDANIFDGLIFQRYFIFVAFLLFHSCRIHILSTCRLAEFFKTRLEFKNSVLVQDTAEFFKTRFSCSFQASPSLLTWWHFHCSCAREFVGNMVWLVFLWISAS